MIDIIHQQMGIKLLSKLLKQECSDVTKTVHLSELYGKKLCIDASIYLYRFKCNEALLENLFLMCSIFRQYNINIEDKACMWCKHLFIRHGIKGTTKKIPYDWVYPKTFSLKKRRSFFK